jgi:hypothetical protein
MFFSLNDFLPYEDEISKAETKDPKVLELLKEYYELHPNEDKTTKRIPLISRWIHNNSSQTIDDTELYTTIGAIEIFNKYERLKKEKSDFLDILLRKIATKILWGITKRLVTSLVRPVVWLVRDILWQGLKGLTRTLIEPILTEVLGFIGINPELWPVFAILGGIGGAGWLIYDAFFKTNKHKKGITFEPPLKNQPRPSSTFVSPVLEKVHSFLSINTKWHLGQTSAWFESGRRGAGTISTGKGDKGGMSYGTYQLASKTGTLSEFLRWSGYDKDFQGLPITSPQFNQEWKYLARVDPNFAKSQYEFIKSTHYDVQLRRLKSLGIDLTNRGPAVQDALWSTAVQYRGLTVDIFSQALRNQDLSQLTDEQIIELVYARKLRGVDQDFHSSSWKTKNSVRNRIPREETSLIRLAESYENPQTYTAQTKSIKSSNTLAFNTNVKKHSKTIVRSPRGVLVALNRD